ncbi:MAG TPA: ATP-binding cassette domain-containing protein [Kofleriaceae bacterium]|nr:ATP-binding cassette domain-containing protein [Kofleriaceae bacterium]
MTTANHLVTELRLARATGFSLDIAMTCPPGITCVMGPSGSGKSTILSLLAGLALPDAGRIQLGDAVWLDRSERATTVNVPTHERKLAYVFQGLALFPHMSALHNVEYGMSHVAQPARAERAKQLLDRLGVGHLAKRRPRTFSGGEAQRVALARAIARSPDLVLLDEPFSALDRELRAEMIGLVRSLVGELAIPMVHVTHSVAEARQLADQVVRIEKGRVVASGAPADVLANIVTLEE